MIVPAARHDEFVDAMQELKAGGMQKLVLDLRNNGGGLVNQAFWVHVNYWFEFRCFVYKAPEKNEFTSLGRFDISKMLNDLLNGVKKASQELKYDVRYND